MIISVGIVEDHFSLVKFFFLPVNNNLKITLYLVVAS